MYEIKVDSTFKADYKRVVRKHPAVRRELEAVIEELVAYGHVSEEYRPHELLNWGGNYNGHIDIHLMEGTVDIIVLYLPHKTNPVIRLVRMGSHSELFQGPLL